MYNELDVKKQIYSSYKWYHYVKIKIKEYNKKGSIVFVTGGTGFYIQSLMNGVSNMPYIPIKLREEITKFYQKIGKAGIYKYLKILDRNTSQYSQESDNQRIKKVLEIVIYTNITITNWRSQKQHPHSNIEMLTILLNPSKQDINYYNRKRLSFMFQKGIIEEVKILNKIDMPNYHPITKAIGVKEINQYIKGEEILRKTLILMESNTRKYIKKQTTWFKSKIQQPVIMNSKYQKNNKYKFIKLILEKIKTY